MASPSAPASPRPRNSNLELLRILSMLAIIAHHYVVCSHVEWDFDRADTGARQCFLQVWGMWGKASINTFILISGYFLSMQRLTWQRYFKVLLQVLVYSVGLMALLMALGVVPVSPRLVYDSVAGLLVGNINGGFFASFLIFYAFVPYYNMLLDAMDRRQTLWLTGGLLLVFSGASTFFGAPTMNEPFWYMTLYLLAACVRRYPCAALRRRGLWWAVLALSVAVSVASALWISRGGADVRYDFLVHDSNKLGGLLVAFSAFMVALNLPPFTSRVVNFLAAGTFGALLIHAVSGPVHAVWWDSIVGVRQAYRAPLGEMMLNVLVAPPAIFMTGVFADTFYRRWIQRPLMAWVSRWKWPGRWLPRV